MLASSAASSHSSITNNKMSVAITDARTNSMAATICSPRVFEPFDLQFETESLATTYGQDPAAQPCAPPSSPSSFHEVPDSHDGGDAFASVGYRGAYFTQTAATATLEEPIKLTLPATRKKRYFSGPILSRAVSASSSHTTSSRTGSETPIRYPTIHVITESRDESPRLASPHRERRKGSGLGTRRSNSAAKSRPSSPTFFSSPVEFARTAIHQFRDRVSPARKAAHLHREEVKVIWDREEEFVKRPTASLREKPALARPKSGGHYPRDISQFHPDHSLGSPVTPFGVSFSPRTPRLSRSVSVWQQNKANNQAKLLSAYDQPSLSDDGGSRRFASECHEFETESLKLDTDIDETSSTSSAANTNTMATTIPSQTSHESYPHHVRAQGISRSRTFSKSLSMDYDSELRILTSTRSVPSRQLNNIGGDEFVSAENEYFGGMGNDCVNWEVVCELSRLKDLAHVRLVRVDIHLIDSKSVMYDLTFEDSPREASVAGTISRVEEHPLETDESEAPIPPILLSWERLGSMSPAIDRSSSPKKSPLAPRTTPTVELEELPLQARRAAASPRLSSLAPKSYPAVPKLETEDSSATPQGQNMTKWRHVLKSITALKK